MGRSTSHHRHDASKDNHTLPVVEQCPVTSATSLMKGQAPAISSSSFLFLISPPHKKSRSTFCLHFPPKSSKWLIFKNKLHTHPPLLHHHDIPGRMSSTPHSAMLRHSHCLIISSPTNVDAFPTEEWVMSEHPICAIKPGCVSNIIGFNYYYFLHKCVFCTRAFSTSVVATTINFDASPPGSTELDDETGHNCQMPQALYDTFCAIVLGLPSDSWENHHSESAFRNRLLQNLDTILHYYVVKYSLLSGKLFLLPGDSVDMARILAHLTILLIGTNACTPHIVSSVWGENNDVCFALGGPRGNLSLICWRLLALSKIVIYTTYIWTTDPRPTHLGPQIAKLQMSSPHPPNPTPTLPQEDHLCLQTFPIKGCLSKAPDGQHASTHLA